jgi:hypothetical protein
MLIVTTFGVALFTLIVPGLTMESLVSVLKVSSRGSRETQLEREIERLDSETANLTKSKKSRQLSTKDYQERLSEIEAMRQESVELLELFQSGQGGDNDGERLRIETELIRAQRECLIQLLKEDNSKPELLQEFRESLDSRYLEIR